MVKINELSERLQEKIRDLKKGIEEISNRPENPKTAGASAAIAFFDILSFIEGQDSWELLKHTEDVNCLKDFICEDGKTELLRDLLEVEYYLGKFPTENPY